MISTTYPLLDAFWIMLWFFAFLAWVWVLMWIVIDIFRSHEIGGLAKALWFFFVLFVPIVGVLGYLVVRGRGMSDRSTARVPQYQHNVVQEPANGAASTTRTSSLEQLARLAQLKDSGALTDAEYRSEKAKLLAS